MVLFKSKLVNKGVPTVPKNISPKVNVMAHLDFKLTDDNVGITYYATTLLIRHEDIPFSFLYPFHILLVHKNIYKYLAVGTLVFFLLSSTSMHYGWLVGWLVLHGISTLVCYLMSNTFYIIIIIISCWQHGYPWPSLATPPYRSSPLDIYDMGSLVGCVLWHINACRLFKAKSYLFI